MLSGGGLILGFGASYNPLSYYHMASICIVATLVYGATWTTIAVLIKNHPILGPVFDNVLSLLRLPMTKTA